MFVPKNNMASHVLVVLLATSITRAQSTTNNTALRHRSLQNTITACVRRRNGQYAVETIRPEELENVIFQGGGFVGERVPYQQGAFVFGTDCKPVRPSSVGQCPAERRTCPDGSTVGLDPNNNCQPFPCSTECCDLASKPDCSSAECCPDGKWSCADAFGAFFCGESGFIEVGFGEPCPVAGCLQDFKECPGGEPVGRDPNNDCNFSPCLIVDPPPSFDCSICPCGWNDGCNTCACDAQDPFLPPRCTRAICPPESIKMPACLECRACTQDVKTCPDGSFVSRNPNNGCAFDPCPSQPASCCPLLDEPGKFNNPFCFSGYRCCPDGKWTCSIGDGFTFPCGEERITSGFGRPCPRSLDYCEECPCGYSDGCNECFCGKDGQAGCTERACPNTPISIQCQSCGVSAEPCCDTDAKPGPNYLCCLDGSWTQQLSSGWGRCQSGAYITQYNQGKTCPRSSKQCCDPLREPGKFGNPMGRESYVCCPVDGKWVFTIGDGRRYPCGDGLITTGFGERCSEPSCCDLSDLDASADSNIPIEGLICCPDGSWAGDIGNGSGTCRNGDVVSRFDGTEGNVCSPSCEACPCGYNDGCNECFCNDDGNLAGCSKRFCVSAGVPSCKLCSAKCCDPTTRPSKFSLCCPDGSWKQLGSDGRAYCGGSYVDTLSQGTICETLGESSCDPEEKPGTNGRPFCADGFTCCPSGQWSCGVGDGTFACDETVVQPSVCPPHFRWCPTNTWVALDPSTGCTQFFLCPSV